VSILARRQDAARVYLLFVAADGLIRGLTFTVLSVYFVQRVGMNPFQLVLVGTVLEGAIVLLELPTGVLADSYSRKLSIVLGQALFGVAYLVQGTVPVFVPILVAETVRAVGETFLSGAQQAWLADEVGTEHLAALFLRGVQLRRVGWLAGIGASVALANLDLALPIKAGGALSAATAVALLMVMPERGFKRAASTHPTALLLTARSGLSAVRRQPVLLALLAVAAVLGAASEGFDRLWEAHLLISITLPPIGNLAPVTWFGLIEAGGLAIGIATARLVSRIDTRANGKVARILVAAQALRVGAIALFGLTSQLPVAIAARWAIEGLQSLNRPLLDAWIARTSPSEVRATVFSVMSQGDAVGQVLGGPVIGALGTMLSLRAAIVASAGLLCPALALLRLAGSLNPRVASRCVPPTGDRHTTGQFSKS
jgi:MFS transporter, DHA3 family, tetracycline resistance protein